MPNMLILAQFHFFPFKFKTDQALMLLTDHVTYYKTCDVESAGAETSQEYETQGQCFRPLILSFSYVTLWSYSVLFSLSSGHFFLYCLLQIKL